MENKQEAAAERCRGLKKRIFGITAFAVLAMAAAGCTSSDLEGGGKKAVDADSNGQQESQAGAEEQSADAAGGAEDGESPKESEEGTEMAGAPEQVRVEEQVLLEQDGVKITLKELDTDSFMGPELKVLIENNSDQNLTVQAQDASVNGIMVQTIFSCDVAAGKSANDGISFMSSDLEEAQIDTLQNFEFRFNIFDADTWDTVIETDTIMVSTNLDGSEEQAVDSGGVILLDQDGIRLTVKEADDTGSFWGADIYVYVENNTGTNVTVQASSAAVNGFMVEPYFSCAVVSGKKSYDTITFMENELKENNIESIDNLEVSFTVFDTDSYETLFETEPLAVQFESAQ